MTAKFTCSLKVNLLIAFVICCFNAVSQTTEHLVLNTGFDDERSLYDWKITDRAKATDKSGVTSVKLTSGYLVYELPVNAVKGKEVKVSFRIKTKNISTPPDGWSGVKVQLRLALPWEDNWSRCPLPEGGFDWSEYSFTTYVPAYTEHVYLEMGMEHVTGRTWIDSISVVALEQNQPTVIQPIENPKLAANKHEIQRGMSVPTMVTDSELQVIASWGANHIRLQMMMDGFPFSRADWIDEYAYRQWLNGVLQHVDSILPTCRKLGLKILLDMHTLPGGKNNPSMVDKIFTNKGWQWIYIKLWQEIADRYKNEPAIWGYDIANEPHEGIATSGILNWHDLAALTAKEIRKIDSTHVIVVESAQDANIEGLCRMQPINVSGVVYSFHFYTPLAFTHQGIYSKDIVAYPGAVVDRAWNVAGIRKVMNAVAEWQRKYSAAIYVGEFSAVRWAPNKNGDAYVDDCIKLFEENKWSWAYFAFRGGGFDGWSAEHNNDKDDHEMSVQPTDRQLLLMRWFVKNKKP